MHDFSLELRLDSPLLLGGPESGEVDSSHMLSCLPVRGLFRTFTRALVGPFLDQNWSRIRDAENRLLGSPASDAGGAGTYRVQDSTEDELTPIRSFPNVPGRNNPDVPGMYKGVRKGYDHASGGSPQRRQVTIRSRPEAVRKGRLFVEMLRTVAWTSFAFGSLGGRARRGYGSLTVEGVTGIPGDDLLPVFGSDLTRDQLASRLREGLKRAREMAREWLQANALDPGEPVGPPATLFQLFGDQFVFVGQQQQLSSEQLMTHLMSAASHQKHHNDSIYKQFIGSGDPRLASPLWVRLYQAQHQAQQGILAVCTLSPLHDSSNPEATAIVGALLGSLLPENAPPVGDCFLDKLSVDAQ